MACYSSSVSDAAALMVGLGAEVAILVFLILRQQRRREARLAELTTVEVPILSTARAALIIAPTMAAGPVLVAVVASLTHPGREHAVAAVLLVIGIGIGGMFAGMTLARRYARVGLLRYAPPRLELEVGGQRSHVDLDQPCKLAEASAEGPSGIRVQVVALDQGDRTLAFSYGLTIGRKPYGEHAVARPLGPLVDPEARVIHDRVRKYFE
jgi:hypothetical protein